MNAARTASDLQSLHRESVVAPIPEIAAFLQEHLGQRITAYLSGLDDTKTVGRWIRSQAAPHERSVFRLREAYQAARLLIEAYDDETARSWFFGTNALVGRAPAAVLRTATEPEETTPVVQAAQAFVAEELGWRAVEAEEERRRQEVAAPVGG